MSAYRCDREPARDDGTPPSAPPSDAYLDAWLARHGIVLRLLDAEYEAWEAAGCPDEGVGA